MRRRTLTRDTTHPGRTRDAEGERKALPQGLSRWYHGGAQCASDRLPTWVGQDAEQCFTLTRQRGRQRDRDVLGALAGRSGC